MSFLPGHASRIWDFAARKSPCDTVREPQPWLPVTAVELGRKEATFARAAAVFRAPCETNPPDMHQNSSHLGMRWLDTLPLSKLSCNNSRCCTCTWVCRSQNQLLDQGALSLVRRHGRDIETVLQQPVTAAAPQSVPQRQQALRGPTMSMMRH